MSILGTNFVMSDIHSYCVLKNLSRSVRCGGGDAIYPFGTANRAVVVGTRVCCRFGNALVRGKKTKPKREGDVF